MTAEELLKNTTDIQPYNATERCVIDPETRVITIPATYQRLGVENDKLVERIEFQCPKIVGDNKNLTEFQLRINYRNANDEKDQYIVKDVREEGENILFSWELSRKVTAYRGIVSFIVCAVIVSDDFTVSNEWNTTVAESEVLEGLEASTQIIQENPDIIEEILKRLDTLETTGGGGIGKETDPTVPTWAKNPTKPTYTAAEVGADASGTAVTKVSEHNTAVDAHNDIRLLVQGLTDRLNALADSDDDTLDQMSEIVAYIKNNKSLIDGITTGKVSVTDIVDNLTTNASNKPLSAAQGVALKALIDGITIPTTLPNPQKLKFTGAVTAEYDGSTEQTVNIPISGGGDYTLPVMSSTQLGGGKAVEKTDEDVPVAVDPSTGQLFVPTYPSGGGGTDKEWKLIADITPDGETCLWEYTDLDNYTELIFIAVGLTNKIETPSTIRLMINDDVEIFSLESQKATGASSTKYQRGFVRYNGMYWEGFKMPQSNNEANYYGSYTNPFSPYSVKMGAEKCKKITLYIVSNYVLSAGNIKVYAR